MAVCIAGANKNPIPIRAIASPARSDAFTRFHAQRLQHVGRPALRTDRPVAVLGHAHARARDHKRRSRRNVEGPAIVAAGSAGIHQRQFGQRGFRCRAAEIHRTHVAPHCAREADQLLDRFALGTQHRQQADDVCLRHAPFEQLFHHGFGLAARKVAARLDFMQ